MLISVSLVEQNVLSSCVYGLVGSIGSCFVAEAR